MRYALRGKKERETCSKRRGREREAYSKRGKEREREINKERE